MVVSVKAKTMHIFDQPILCLDTNFTEMHKHIPQCTGMFIAVLFTISPHKKLSKYPVDKSDKLIVSFYTMNTT